MRAPTFIGFLVGVAGAVAAAQSGGVVAEVGSTVILEADVSAYLDAARAQGLLAGRFDAFAGGARQAAIDDLVGRRLLALAARESGVDKRPDVRRRIEAAVDEILAAVVADERTSVSANDVALRGYYGAHPDEFRGDGRVHARHLVLKMRAEAERLRTEVLNGADFAQLASAHNIDASRTTGGDLGWVRKGVMVAEFERVLVALKAGEISPVVQTSYGYHVIQVVDVEPGALPPFEQIRETVRQKLLAAELRAFKDRLLERYPVRVH